MRAFSIFILCLVLTSCRTSNLLSAKEEAVSNDSVATTFAYDPNYQYRIKKDDKISISIWGQDELSVGSLYGIYNSNEVYGKWLMVDARGNIEIPKIGTTNVLGKTIIELKEYLRDAFKKWIVNPVLDVKVLNKEISVLGEVRTPGNYTIDKDQNNLLEILSKAGGLEFYANIRYIKIIRQEGESVRIATLNLAGNDHYKERNIQLHAGDIVIVPSKKYKEFDKRASVIIPFTTAASAAAILVKLL